MQIITVTGGDVTPHLADVAALRIAVFRDWPYLYDGDAGYERQYLATYARSRESLFVLAYDDGRLVGASTGVPLADEVEAFRRPFREAGLDERTVFYFGESVLLGSHRGRGIGHRFFDAREAHARSRRRFGWTAFCAVLRDAADPRRPDDYRTLDPFWAARGYVRRPAMVARIAWKELGESEASEKPLACWLRPLGAGAPAPTLPESRR